MTIKYKATFADGSIQKRTSASGRIYSHCWRVQYQSPSGSVYSAAGFAGSRDLAASAVRQATRYSVPSTVSSEIVPVEIIPPKARKSREP